MLQQLWHRRNPRRLPDLVWNATLRRVRGEFDEMPSIRVTVEQACALFGLREHASSVLKRLKDEGFLSQTPQGEYVRRTSSP